MPDLLLTHGYFLYEDPKELQILKPYVPLGILYICSHLRAKGFDVEVFDSTFSSIDTLLAKIQSAPPSILGVYANLMTRKNVVRILATAREAGWKTIVGGPEPGAYALEYLQAGADVVVLGEGEITMEEVLPAIQGGGIDALENVAGISYLDESGNMQTTAPRAQIPDLDAQPWPARDAIDLPKYMKTWREAHGQGSISVITARGCPYKCRWCSHQVYGQTHRRRSPKLVVDEVQFLLETYSPEMMWVADDVFTIHHGWLREYAAEMKRRGLHVPFECISRADRMNEEIVELLAELGCFRVWIGSESGSQRLLDSMQRGVTVPQVQKAIEMCRANGIESGMFLMWGYEGEELEDIEATVEHVKRSQPDIFFTTVAYPIKGTPYYERVAKDLIVIRPWGESSDRELVISNQKQRSFYETADRLLRDEVELARLETRGVNGGEMSTLRVRIDEARTRLYSMNSVEVRA